jgi:hypothetical protein
MEAVPVMDVDWPEQIVADPVTDDVGEALTLID